MLDAPLTTGPVTDIAGRVGGAVGAGRSSHATASITTVRESRTRSEEHTSELQSQSNLVCRLLLEKKKDTDRPPASRYWIYSPCLPFPMTLSDCTFHNCSTRLTSLMMPEHILP